MSNEIFLILQMKSIYISKNMFFCICHRKSTTEHGFPDKLRRRKSSQQTWTLTAAENESFQHGRHSVTSTYPAWPRPDHWEGHWHPGDKRGRDKSTQTHDHGKVSFTHSVTFDTCLGVVTQWTVFLIICYISLLGRLCPKHMKDFTSTQNCRIAQQKGLKDSPWCLCGFSSVHVNSPGPGQTHGSRGWC